MESGAAKLQLEAMLANVELAKKKRCPMCQDTGILNVFCNYRDEFPEIGILKEVIEHAVSSSDPGNPASSEHG